MVSDPSCDQEGWRIRERGMDVKSICTRELPCLDVNLQKSLERREDIYDIDTSVDANHHDFQIVFKFTIATPTDALF